jgi:hypothetical protein
MPVATLEQTGCRLPQSGLVNPTPVYDPKDAAKSTEYKFLRSAEFSNWLATRRATPTM